MPIDVFVAYVDTFLGKQLLQQFQASPHLFTVHGCTWSADVAQELNEKAAARRQGLLHLDGTIVSTISALSTAREHDSQTSLHGNGDSGRGSPSANHTAGGETAQDSNGKRATALLIDSQSLTASQGTKAFLNDGAAASPDGASGGVGVSGRNDMVPATALPGLTHFFSRSDVSAVRNALFSCEWIVVEQRQSQEVLDMLSCVQQGVFDRPKKFILLSSFMTWYATPPLSSPEDKAGGDGEEEEDDEAATAGAAAIAGFDDVVGGGGDTEDEAAEDGVGDDINAPYPPPPDVPSEADEEETDNRSDLEADEDAEEGGANEGDKEVLTEDQYNRRVPHVKFYNWREAEKAVAAAHHAKGLPLDTYVVFAGLPYGEGEDFLEPFFRQAWCGTSCDDAAAKDTPRGTLPIYGDGSQCVPLIHVRDLATFTRKLLYRPISALPSRYIFATDGARPTWRALMEAVNHAFGDQCKLSPVSPAEFPLHKHIEQFTVDLRVERGTMASLLEEMTWDANEGDVSLASAGGARSGAAENSLWVSEGGLRRHLEKVALEFCQERNVTPLRIVLQGPPLAGKRFLGSRLGAFYRLPSFSIDDVVDAYKACLADKQRVMDGFRKELLANELARRKAIRKRRLLNAYRNGKRITVAAPQETEKEEAASSAKERKVSNSRRSPSAGVRSSFPVTPEGGKGGPATSLGAAEAKVSDEPDASLFELTEAEIAEAEELIGERFDSSARVARWRQAIQEMERVLLMRMRVPPSGTAAGQGHGFGDDAAGTGPMKKRSVAATKSKKLTKEQQRKKEEEELLQAKDALKDAPFQDKALAIMLRWRLDHADCRTRGYVLHGFPRTVEQARLAFGSEALEIPRTEEEALNPPPAPPAAQQAADGEDEEGDADPMAGLSSEPSEESRLPSVVLVLEAPENYLLDRLAAVSALKQQELAANIADGNDPWSPNRVAAATTTAERPEGDDGEALSPVNAAEKAKFEFLQRFHEHLRTFKQEFMQSPYTLLSYWECAVTEPGRVTPGGRRAEVHLVAVHDSEPLVPPPPPSSAFELAQPCEVELKAQSIIGAAHNFGKTPLELHREAVRKVRLAQEHREAEQRREQQEKQRDAAAYNAEAQLREVVEGGLLTTKKADLAAMEERKAPLRDYLMESVVPLVSKGLMEVAAKRPENPLEYLSEWLIRHNPNNDVFIDI